MAISIFQISECKLEYLLTKYGVVVMSLVLVQLCRGQLKIVQLGSCNSLYTLMFHAFSLLNSCTYSQGLKHSHTAVSYL